MSLDIERGQFVVIVGSNGAGKSTLINVIAGEHLPDSGTIELGGRDVTRVPTIAERGGSDGCSRIRWPARPGR